MCAIYKLLLCHSRNNPFRLGDVEADAFGLSRRYPLPVLSIDIQADDAIDQLDSAKLRCNSSPHALRPSGSISPWWQKSLDTRACGAGDTYRLAGSVERVTEVRNLESATRWRSHLVGHTTTSTDWAEPPISPEVSTIQPRPS
jgi:hypothetical protein